MLLPDDPVYSQAREKTFRKRAIFALPLLLGLVLLLAMSATTSRHSDSLFDRSLFFFDKGGAEELPEDCDDRACFDDCNQCNDFNNQLCESCG
jgi:hypothetical protein